MPVNIFHNNYLYIIINFLLHINLLWCIFNHILYAYSIPNWHNKRMEDVRKKNILAYSGGLDTAIIPYQGNYDYEVICVCIDVGQESELDGLEERAKLSGATKLYIEDVVDEFVDDYIIPCVKAGAVYEHKYLLGTSMARPVIAKDWLRLLSLGATAACHGQQARATIRCV